MNFIKNHKILITVIFLIVVVLFTLLFVSSPDNRNKSEESLESTETQLIGYDTYDELYAAIEKSFEEKNEEAEDFYLAMYLAKVYWDENTKVFRGSDPRESVILK